MSDPSGAFNVISCGVGGQGVVVMSNVVGQACAATGLNVISGEMHGLAQRNGAVIIHQRVGERVLSPLIPWGEADVIVSLELSEALRHLRYLRPGGTVITSGRIIHPPGETHALIRKGAESYVGADRVREAIRASGCRYVEFDALALAKEAGNALTENVVMTGALCAVGDFPVSEEAMRRGVELVVPKGKLEVNLKAFELGLGACRDGMC